MASDMRSFHKNTTHLYFRVMHCSLFDLFSCMVQNGGISLFPLWLPDKKFTTTLLHMWEGI